MARVAGVAATVVMAVGSLAAVAEVPVGTQVPEVTAATQVLLVPHHRAPVVAEAAEVAVRVLAYIAVEGKAVAQGSTAKAPMVPEALQADIMAILVGRAVMMVLESKASGVLVMGTR